jgi:hypothetical protein
VFKEKIFLTTVLFICIISTQTFFVIYLLKISFVSQEQIGGKSKQNEDIHKV